MGGLLQPRKNPFMAQGLQPGVMLRMALSRREDAELMSTTVEHVDAERIEVLVPMLRMRARPHSPGTRVHAAYTFRQKTWQFVTEVAGHSADGRLEFLTAPRNIESIERRLAFRLATSIRPETLYKVVIDEEMLASETDNTLNGTIVDLSQGGLCISSQARLMPGERLGLQAVLGDCGEITARVQVLRVEEPPSGKMNRRIHCQFTDISRGDRDKVAKFLMKRQLEMRRRGQL